MNDFISLFRKSSGKTNSVHYILLFTYRERISEMNETKIINQALTRLTEHTGLTGEWLPLRNGIQKPIEVERPTTNSAFTKPGLKTVFYLLLNEDAINLIY